MYFELPKNIKLVLNTLIQNGHDAYIVGGCVRDLLCGKTPNDYDITTSALPDETQSLFEKTIATGLKHGTITVMIDKEPIEVTTFRTECGYNDSRHPESVNFVRKAQDDLARRDFTINAMCYNEQEGLIDLFGGREDIDNKILRTVGNAKTRFSEDALRILRLFRFAATLQFRIEKNTFDAAIQCAQLLKNISAERIFTELVKTANSNDPTAVSPLIKTNALEKYCVTSNALSEINNLPNNSDLRTFALLYTTSSDLSKTLDAFKCSNNFKDYCKKLETLIQNGINADKTSIKKALNFADYAVVLDCLSYFQGILNSDVSHHLLLLEEVKVNTEPYKTSHLDITGNDIANLGFKGEQIGEKLEFLLDNVIKNPELNSREKLLNLICN